MRLYEILKNDITQPNSSNIELENAQKFIVNWVEIFGGGNPAQKQKLFQDLPKILSYLKVTEEIINNLEENLEYKEQYYSAVKYLTNITYNRYKNILDKDSLRGNGYHLDHRFSIIQGFINKIPPEIISSIYNLEIILEKDNLSKNSNCSITDEELLKKYNDQ